MGVYIPNIKKPKHCTECYFVSRDQCELQDNSYDYDTFKEQREHCPLIDIVTCGECKWFIAQGEGNVGKCTYRTRPILYCLPTDFCSYGERRK